MIMDLLLPKDGSIVIIDDQYNEAKPLLDILTKNGHPSIYFDGDLDNLPKNKSLDNVPLERVRVVFADIQLKPALTEDQYVSFIIEHLNSLISDKNGPYVLIVWSGKEVQLADRLKEMIEAEAFKKKPISFIRLNKLDYFKTRIKGEYDLSSLKEDIETRFTPGDVEFILTKIKEVLPNEQEYICDTPALKRISLRIRSELKNYQAFELLMKWEYLVMKAATRLTSEFASIHKGDKYWDYNFRNIISRLAQAQVGDFLKGLNNKSFLKASFKTINAAFSDYLDNEVTSLIKLTPNELATYKKSGYAKVENGIEYKIIWNNYEHYQLYINDTQQGGNNIKSIDTLSSSLGNRPAEKAIVNKMILEYREFNPELNTKFNIDPITRDPFQPGSSYEIIVERLKKRKFLNDTYFDIKKTNFSEVRNDALLFVDEMIDKFKFIELEISPNCDFANNKWLKHRTISGIFYPEEIIKIDKIQSGDSLYTEFPLIKVNGQIMRVLFSFKLLKSFDLSKAKKGVGISCLRSRSSQWLIS